MPIGTKVGAASSGGNIKLKESIGRVVGPARYSSNNLRLGSLSKTAWINRRDYSNQSTDGSSLVQESSPDSFYSYYSSGDGNSSDYQQDGSWNGANIKDNTPATMGEFAGVQNDYWSVGTQLVGQGIPQRYIGFSPASQVSSSYKHAAAARNDFGFGTGLVIVDFTIGTYIRRNGDHLSIYVGATKQGFSGVSTSGGGRTTGEGRSIGALNTVQQLNSTAPFFTPTTPFGNSQPVDYKFHGSTITSETAWYDASSNNTDPASNHKEIYRITDACASDGPTAEPHSGGNGSGEFVTAQMLPPITSINVNTNDFVSQTVSTYYDNGTTKVDDGTTPRNFSSTNTVLGAQIRTAGLMFSGSSIGFESLGIAVPFLITISGSGTPSNAQSISTTGANSGSSSELNNQTYSGGQGVLQENAAGSHSTSDMLRTGYLSQKLIMVGIRADTHQNGNVGSVVPIGGGFNFGDGNFLPPNYGL